MGPSATSQLDGRMDKISLDIPCLTGTYTYTV